MRFPESQTGQIWRGNEKHESRQPHQVKRPPPGGKGKGKDSEKGKGKGTGQANDTGKGKGKGSRTQAKARRKAKARTHAKTKARAKQARFEGSGDHIHPVVHKVQTLLAILIVSTKIFCCLLVNFHEGHDTQHAEASHHHSYSRRERVRV